MAAKFARNCSPDPIAVQPEAGSRIVNPPQLAVVSDIDSRSRPGETTVSRRLARENARAVRLPRRHLLRIGGLSVLGLNLADLLRVKASQVGRRGARPIESCIVLFYYGGPSHHDTWDMKPDAPAEVRGEFRPIATSAPGLFLSEPLGRIAKVAHRLAVIRSFHHPMRNHNSAAVEALCGRTPLKGDLELLAPDANDFPCYGASVSASLPSRSLLPSHIALPHVMYNVVKLPGQTSGFLGSEHEPFQLAADPNTPDFRVGELVLPSGMTLERLDDRASLLRQVDRQYEAWEKQAHTSRLDVFAERAYRLLRSDAVRRAFDLSGEDPRTRDRYGRNIHGQSVLLARRLVESGVRFVNVNDKVHNGPDNWDTHDRNFSRLKEALLPPADQAFSALIEDLEARGRLDTTLVVWIGEFGRTPRINSQGGRDHWPDCFSVILAGGGVEGGTTFGASDRLGAYPASEPVTPGDLAATIFWRFGLDTARTLYDLNARPYRLADGEPLRALFRGAA